MPRPYSIGLITLVAFLLQLTPTLSRSDPAPTISIIIDDIGHHKNRGFRAINLPARLTYAVIPDSAHASHLANYAHDIGKEVILHMPMENTTERPIEELALTKDLSHEDFLTVFEAAISQVPHVRGVNNHMGSALTQEPLAMTWLMEAVKKHQLFFVDSRTTHKSVAGTIARQQSVLSASRDVFLDNKRTTFDIDRQFRLLLSIAKRKQSAIAIGHPHAETLMYLEHALPILQEEGIQIVPVSELIGLRLAQHQLASFTGGSE